MQQLNIFDLRSLLFNKFPLESLNPSRSFLEHLLYLLPILISYIFIIFIFLGILEFWCLVTVTFKFTV